MAHAAQRTMAEIGAILLAAGLSRRMGPQNKLLLPIAARPMILHVAQTYLSAIDGTLTVVVGHEANAVRAALSDLPLNMVENPDFADGQPTSVAAGLRHAPEADLLLIGLGDQPQLTPADIKGLIAAHKSADLTKISIPVQGDVRGNPILIPAWLRPRLLEDPDRPGCMHFIRKHPEHVQRLTLSAAGFFADIDTPEVYADVQMTMPT